MEAAIQPRYCNVRLYGRMGSQFGRVHRFLLESGTTSEAISALISQVKGVRQYFAEAKEKGIEFAVFVGRRNLIEKELPLPVGEGQEIRIAPVLRGSKRGGVLQTIVGIVLIVVGAYISEYDGGATLSAGIGMVVGGVVQMLTPLPKGLHSKDSPENTPSYSFNGPVNTQAQGVPVPLLYGGPMKVGSAVISAGIDTDDTSVYSPGAGPGHMGGGGGCVTAESYVHVVRPDGSVEAIHAGEVRVGDVLQGADPETLEPRTALVTYSETVEQPCVEIELGYNVRLRCSRSAPIPTPEGLVYAPDLEGLAAAKRDPRGEGWAGVEAVHDIGPRFVQHLTVDDGADGHCFWAGDRPEAQILHHNKQAAITVQDGR